MTWTNAFDTGECTVKVTRSSASVIEYFSGVIGKGETSAEFETDNEICTVSVSAAGEAQLNFVSQIDPELTRRDGYALEVVPATSIDGKAVRARAMTISPGRAMVSVYAYFNDLSAGLYSFLSGADAAWAPDPVSPDSSDGIDRLAVFMGHVP